MYCYERSLIQNTKRKSFSDLLRRFIIGNISDPNDLSSKTTTDIRTATRVISATGPTYVYVTGYIFDSVLQWAYGVNMTLEQGYPPDDGFRITQNIFNLEFPGIAGTVVIDEVGDRKPDLR